MSSICFLLNLNSIDPISSFLFHLAFVCAQNKIMEYVWLETQIPGYLRMTTWLHSDSYQSPKNHPFIKNMTKIFSSFFQIDFFSKIPNIFPNWKIPTFDLYSWFLNLMISNSAWIFQATMHFPRPMMSLSSYLLKICYNKPKLNRR